MYASNQSIHQCPVVWLVLAQCCARPVRKPCSCFAVCYRNAHRAAGRLSSCCATHNKQPAGCLGVQAVWHYSSTASSCFWGHASAVSNLVIDQLSGIADRPFESCPNPKSSAAQKTTPSPRADGTTLLRTPLNTYMDAVTAVHQLLIHAPKPDRQKAMATDWHEEVKKFGELSVKALCAHMLTTLLFCGYTACSMQLCIAFICHMYSFQEVLTRVTCPADVAYNARLYSFCC